MKQNKTEYWKKLLDPRWQRKRLEIFKRDNFTCRDCGQSDQELHVHHTFYTKPCEPWEYPDDSLITLCKECHGFRTVSENELKHCFSIFTSLDIDSLVGSIALVKARGANATEIMDSLQSALEILFYEKEPDKKA